MGNTFSLQPASRQSKYILATVLYSVVYYTLYFWGKNTPETQAYLRYTLRMRCRSDSVLTCPDASWGRFRGVPAKTIWRRSQNQAGDAAETPPGHRGLGRLNVAYTAAVGLNLGQSHDEAKTSALQAATASLEIYLRDASEAWSGRGSQTRSHRVTVSKNIRTKT